MFSLHSALYCGQPWKHRLLAWRKSARLCSLVEWKDTLRATVAAVACRVLEHRTDTAPVAAAAGFVAENRSSVVDRSASKDTNRARSSGLSRVPACLCHQLSATLVTASRSLTLFLLSIIWPLPLMERRYGHRSVCSRNQLVVRPGSTLLRALCVLSSLLVYPFLSPLLPSVALVVAVISTLPPCHKLTFPSLPPVNAPVDSFKFAFFARTLIDDSLARFSLALPARLCSGCSLLLR